jgi:uncharacterized protein YkwD
MFRAITRPTRTTLSLLVALAVAATMLVGSAAPAEAKRNHRAEKQMVGLINQARSAAGLVKVKRRADIGYVAHAWSVQMAKMDAKGRLKGGPIHNDPSWGPGQGYQHQLCCWSRVSENVALWKPPAGVTLTQAIPLIHEALMNSTDHRKNILDRKVRQVGVGIDVRNGGIYITQNFRKMRKEPLIGRAQGIGVSSKNIDKGQRVAVRGRLMRAGKIGLGGQRVVLQRKTATGWKKVAAKRTDTMGRVVFRPKPRQDMRFRLVAPKWSGWKFARSTSRLVRVG